MCIPRANYNSASGLSGLCDGVTDINPPGKTCNTIAKCWSGSLYSQPFTGSISVFDFLFSPHDSTPTEDMDIELLFWIKEVCFASGRVTKTFEDAVALKPLSRRNTVFMTSTFFYFNINKKWNCVFNMHSRKEKVYNKTVL